MVKATNQDEEQQDAPAPETNEEKLAQDIADEFFQKGRVRSGYSLRFETSGGATRPVIEKLGGK